MRNTYRKELEKTERKKKRNSHQKPQRQQKWMRFLKAFLITMLVIVIVITGSLISIRMIGKRQLQDSTVGSVAEMKMDTNLPASGQEDSGDDAAEENGSNKKEQTYEEKEGRVFYQGKVYDFNRDIMTFLVMGIDQRSAAVREQTEGFEGGSADAIFLVVLNPHTKKMKIIAVDRNTMTDVDIYDYYGNYEKTIETQICVQHGFGDGTVKSAGYMEKAVSNLLYGLPINGYCAVNMSAIEKINDSIGGVEVTVLDDLTKWDKTLQKGETVHLMGKSAFLYVQRRDTGIFGSAEGRLERQKQYINAFIRKAKEEFKRNPTLPITLFRELNDYMTTDLNVEKAAYLAGMAAGFDFKSTDITKIEGENVMGEEYEEFYVDEAAMYELILDTFYEEIS